MSYTEWNTKHGLEDTPRARDAFEDAVAAGVASERDRVREAAEAGLAEVPKLFRSRVKEFINKVLGQ